MSELQKLELQTAANTREHARNVLIRIWRAVAALGTNKIDAAQAIAAGIQQQSMSLEKGSDQHPVYFIPFTEKVAPIEYGEYPSDDPKYDACVNTRDLGLPLSTYTLRPLFGEYVKRPGIYYKDWGDFNFGALYEASVEHNWFVCCACPASPRDLRLPYMKWWIYNEVEDVDNGQLTRGEVLSIIQVMIGRLNTKSLRPHVTAPVLVFSVVATMQIRVLEGYFDGKRLIIRMTKLYDMKEYDEATMGFLIQWLLGYSVGDTKNLPNPLLS